MRLLNWFFSKLRLKFVLCFFLLLFAASEAQAQYKTVQYKVSQKETLYKISKIYNTRVDSLIKWNDLSSSMISPGQIIVIHDYYKLQEEELTLNRVRYNIGANETSRNEDLSVIQMKMDSLEQAKGNVDDSDPYAMVQYFDIANSNIHVRPQVLPFEVIQGES